MIGLLLTVGVLGAAFWVWLTSDLPSIGALQAGLALPSIRIFDRHGTLLYEILPPEQGRNTPIALEDIPRQCVNAVIATEDANFYAHPGVDPIGIIRALWINILGGEVLAGGSTITQQVARLTLLNPRGLPERTFKRKLQEAVLALRLETAYSKDQVLEIYLNQSYFGSLAYGIEAAARTYFGKSAPELSVSECTLLAGLLQAPALYDPLVNPQAAAARQAVVARLMTENGYLTPVQAETILRDPLNYAAVPFPIEAPHFVMSVWAQLEQSYPDALYRDGLDVVTTLDLDWQHAAEQTTRSQLARLNDPENPDRPPADANNAALVALDPRTGEVLALLGSPDYFDKSISGAVNAALALRQPGSALKPFTYAAAFNPARPDAWSPATVVLDVATAFTTRKGELYTPANYGFAEHGPVSARVALASSLNIPAVMALQTVGVRTMVDLSARAGMTSLAGNTDLDLAVTLGGGEVRLLDLVSAYAVFPRGGTPVSPTLIQSVTVRGGQVLYQWQPPEAGVNLIDPRVAWLITDILADNDARSLGFGAQSLLNIGRPAASKTGTTTDFRDNWVVGYTPSLVVGVWVGNADNRPMVNATGITGAAPIWHHFMREVLNGVPEEPFGAPPADLLSIEVCTLSGLLPSPICPQTRREWFIPGTEPTSVDASWHLLEIDSRTRQLADASTPDDAVTTELFVVLPAEAERWARGAGLNLLPPEFAGAIESADNTKNLAALRVIAPNPGAVFQVSASMPRVNQRLRLEAAAPTDVALVRLLLNGEIVSEFDHGPFAVFWELEPGSYEIVAQAVGADGTITVSDPINFRVLDVGERP
ncbi:MAG: transglycosylase domain-containing protein [Chloroflexi bacterium]|nr:transglycosylase domain-containing protein [Chloroflexota bacterium]